MHINLFDVEEVIITERVGHDGLEVKKLEIYTETDKIDLTLFASNDGRIHIQEGEE